MIICNSQQDVVIDIPSNVTTIALKISGGADSAILCYILALYKFKYRPDLIINTITSISSLKPYQKIFADRILEKISKMTDINFNERFIQHVNTDNYINEQIEFSKYLREQKKYQLLFVGETKNPPIEISKDHKAPEGRDSDNMPTIRGFCHMPFKNINKKGIKELYDTLNVLEEIFPLTRSCEEFPTTDFSKHCEKCWFCAERFWGFNRYI